MVGFLWRGTQEHVTDGGGVCWDASSAMVEGRSWMEENLQRVAKAVHGSANSCGLSCSPQKSQLLVIKPRKKKGDQENVRITIEGMTITPTTQARILGVIFQNNGKREQAPIARDDAGPATVQQQLLKHCQQEAPVTFEVALRLTDDCRRCLKLGEGCTADVYRIRRPSGHESAVKVIPVGGSRNEDGELPMSLSSVILECVMTRELSNLRFNEANQSSNFIELKRTHSVRGTYHPVLMKSWKDYDNQSGSENSDPGK
ncbi:serine/threonine-protein kinase haspin homolog [Dermacentor albipictus]|uniref:serine/threonine-protein kinase haspin homolog n=1 Tax=Dermacentor albipictus TaxID=60249 RepID=UPI0038FC1207